MPVGADLEDILYEDSVSVTTEEVTNDMIFQDAVGRGKEDHDSNDDQDLCDVPSTCDVLDTTDMLRRHAITQSDNVLRSLLGVRKLCDPNHDDEHDTDKSHYAGHK